MDAISVGNSANLTALGELLRTHELCDRVTALDNEIRDRTARGTPVGDMPGLAAIMREQLNETVTENRHRWKVIANANAIPAKETKPSKVREPRVPDFKSPA